MWETHWGDGMPPEGLVDDGFNIGQLRPVGEGGEFIRSNDTVEFLLGLFLNVWV